MDGAEAVIEVGPEAALLDAIEQRTVRRGNDPHVRDVQPRHERPLILARELLGAFDDERPVHDVIEAKRWRSPGAHDDRVRRALEGRVEGPVAKVRSAGNQGVQMHRL